MGVHRKVGTGDFYYHEVRERSGEIFGRESDKVREVERGFACSIC